MKKIFLILSLTFSCGSENSSNEKQYEQQGEGEDPIALVNSFPVYDLTDEQKEDMLFMWEEEKLARDVYTHFIGKWGSKPFVNISKSEQVHVDSIGALLIKYEIEKPQNADEAGQFENEVLAQLYQDLITQGEASEREAFVVGKAIEDLDIADLEKRIPTANEDAKAIYENLLKASYKHLAAFEKQLAK